MDSFLKVVLFEVSSSSAATENLYVVQVTSALTAKLIGLGGLTDKPLSQNARQLSLELGAIHTEDEK